MSPVVGARIISGLIPCTVIPDEILTDHPDRYRGAARRERQPGPIVLYRALGPALPDGAAILRGAAHRCALGFESSVRRAGFTGEGLALGEAVFDVILASPSGVTFALDEWADVERRTGHADGRVSLVVDDRLEEFATLATEPLDDRSGEFPLVLSAGEQRAFTANTIIRDSSWRRSDGAGALRVHPNDAAQAGIVDGDPGRGELVRVGVAPNDFTDNARRDPVAGTPWHKFVPARVEAVAGP